MSKLKPCPFCGSEKDDFRDHPEHCFLYRLYKQNENTVNYCIEEMHEAWNTRTSQKRIDELERALCNVIFRTDQYKYAVYDQYYGCDDAEDAIDSLIAETNQALTPKEKEK